jgi:hypothetical protein
MSANGQTNAVQVPDRPRTRRRGGQPGNRNAKKPVLAIPTIVKRVRALKRRARDAIATLSA